MFSYINKYNIKLPLLSGIKSNCMLRLKLAIIKSTEYTSNSILFFHATTAPGGPEPPHCRGFTITDIPQSVGLLWTRDRHSQSPLPDKIQHSQETYIPPAEFEPAFPASERLQIHALDRAATGTGNSSYSPTEVQSVIIRFSQICIYFRLVLGSFRCSYTNIIIIIINIFHGRNNITCSSNCK
jgi:hypothetical protein